MDELVFVVAAHGDGVRVRADELDDTPRVGALADEVADEDDEVVVSEGEPVEQRLEFVETAVDVPNHIDVVVGVGVNDVNALCDLRREVVRGEVSRGRCAVGGQQHARPVTGLTH